MIVEQAVHFPATQFNKWTGQNESYTHSYLLKLMLSLALLNQFFAQNVCLQYIRYKVGQRCCKFLQANKNIQSQCSGQECGRTIKAEIYIVTVEFGKK